MGKAIKGGWALVACILGACASSPVLAASEESILKALKAAGLSTENVKLRNGQGRIDVDPVNKRSYYVFTPNPSDPKSPTYVIPLSTVRYTPRNYSTSEWWEANKEAIAAARADRKPTPTQDPNEVREFLEANNLSTNPDVIVIGESGKYRTEPLQDFLLREYRMQGETVRLFRGSLRSTEQAQWEKVEMAWGSQYYTPSATYGWRYARKMPGAPFLDLAKDGKAPLFEFTLPYKEFAALVERGEFTLGVELPKSAHDRFDREGVFRDALYGNSLYLGDPTFGLEFEITASKPARQRLVRAYQGSVSPVLLGEKAEEQIARGSERLMLQFPEAPLHEEAVELGKVLEGGNGSRGIFIPDDLKSCLRQFKAMRGNQ